MNKAKQQAIGTMAALLLSISWPDEWGGSTRGRLESPGRGGGMITAVADTGADRRAATTLGGMDQGNSGDAGRGTARPKAGSSFVAG